MGDAETILGRTAKRVSETRRCAIDVANLSHCYNSGSATTQILQNVSLQVDAGEMVALIGRSGSGKSTLLNLISGLEPISQGDVKLNQRSIGQLGDAERTRLRGREIGFIYQSFNLIPTLSINDNITLPLALAGVSVKEQELRLPPLLDVVGLAKRGTDYPDRLSGGEQQRVAIARALIHRPALILADEPTGNLDAQSGRLVLDLLVKLVREQDSALLLVTHSVEVASIADRILELDQSQVNAVAPGQLHGGSAW